MSKTNKKLFFPEFLEDPAFRTPIGLVKSKLQHINYLITSLEYNPFDINKAERLAFESDTLKSLVENLQNHYKQK